MRNVLAISVLALAASTAHADFSCEPKLSPDSTAPGTIQVFGNNELGSWSYFWCPEPSKPGFWRWNYHTVLKKYRNTVSDPIAMIRGILEAPNRLQAMNSAMLSAEIIPAVGSQDEYEQLRLIYAACVAAESPPANMVPSIKKPAASCIEPTPPLATTWVAVGGSLFTYVGARLTGLVSGRKALAGAPTTPTKLTVGTDSYCSLINGIQTEVTKCQKP